MTRKLYDRKGGLMGTVTFPEEWADHLRNGGYVKFLLDPFPRLRPYRSEDNDPALSEPIRTAVLHTARAYRGGDDGVGLEGIDVEEFEKHPGCSFSPSAAWVRGHFGATPVAP